MVLPSGQTEVLVEGTALVGEINQAGERAMLDLPFIAPVGDVVPVAIVPSACLRR